MIAAGGTIAPLEARLLSDDLLLAEFAVVGDREDLAVALVAAPLPGLDYHLDAALFVGDAEIHKALANLLTRCGRGARSAMAALGLGDKFEADLQQPDRSARAPPDAAAILKAMATGGCIETPPWAGSGVTLEGSTLAALHAATA